MKKHIYIVYATLFLFVFCLQARAQSPADIIRQVDELMNPNAKLVAKLIHMNKSGEIDEDYVFRLYSKDNNQKIIVRTISSISSEGREDDLIMIENNVWFYDVDAGRVMKIPSNQSFGSTDFSYGDVLRLNLTDNYEASILTQNKYIWVINLKAKNRNAPYYRIEYEIKKEGYVPVRGKCYGKNNEVIKTMEFTEVKEVNERLRPTKLIVASPYSEGDYSAMTFISEELKNYPDKIFNKRNLALRMEENF
ncbi:MAG: outer membrane lipoprotein-sorting protein [Thermoplasmata archaeon]|nr:MAG: outer membrane lipoprotein-sorting protein [Thermoplasmata archaeon]